jgi:hypothetical protein
MGTIHRLVMSEGVEAARRSAESATDRRAIEAAAIVMADEAARIGITHAGFAMTALPHRRVEEHIWRRESPRATLLVESGHDRQGVAVGVPYGSLARLILLYLQTEAVRTGSPEVELGRSMNAWLGRMQIAGGGRTRTLVSEQARRISACRLTFFTDRGPGVESRHNGAFVRDAISLSGLADKDQPSLWQDRVRLDEGYFASLTAHPVPVREEAIRAIGQRSMAIDVYVWLAYRLHVLDKPTAISWTAVNSQFGSSFAVARQAKAAFITALKIAGAAYPEARVDVETAGLVLHPSPPAVPKVEARRLRIE